MQKKTTEKHLHGKTYNSFIKKKIKLFKQIKDKYKKPHNSLKI